MRRRVLIFEDNRHIRAVVEALFKRRGYEVLSYPHPGICPLAGLMSCPCPLGTICADMIVSDIQMPGINGLDFVEGLLSKNCKRPQIALMSGTWIESELARAHRLGCKILEKPFSPSDLLRWIDDSERQLPEDRGLFDWVV